MLSTMDYACKAAQVLDITQELNAKTAIFLRASNVPVRRIVKLVRLD